MAVSMQETRSQESESTLVTSSGANSLKRTFPQHAQRALKLHHQ